MFSKRDSLSITKGQPLIARQQTIEVKASSTEEFLKAEKFEKSQQGGSSACNFIYSAAAVQGFRSRMQDDYVCTPNITIKGSPYGFFGVFDGHGEQGEIVSQFCADNILKQLLHRKAMRQSKVVTNELLAASVHKTMIKLDTQLQQVEVETRTMQFRYGGTTACFVLISQDDIMFVNVGDSRAVLCRDGSVVFETKDHNPDVPEEEERITAGGGRVHTTPSKQKIITDKDGFNNLCVSRTIGDFNFKPTSELPRELQPVTPAPDINVVSRDLTKDEFLVIASDGIYKSLSSTQVVQFVSRQLMITDDLTKICRNLIDTAYFAEGNIPDDTTVVLIKFSGAPSISHEAVTEERHLDLEATAAIEQEIKEMIGRADNIKAVDNDFNIAQRLVQKLPVKYRVQQRVAFIIETATRLRMEKFGASNGHILLTDKNSSSQNESHSTTCEEAGSSNSEKKPSIKQATGEDTKQTAVKTNTAVSTDKITKDSSDHKTDHAANRDNTLKDSEDVRDPSTDSAGSHGNGRECTIADAGSDSNMETTERIQYCVIESSDGEVKDQEAIPLSRVES